ncbi:BZ3500_MvSof-1268-A1-R1_Chr7-1g09171 [Microbotryum saponariae]|uniref:BZ3500_MvSof-1268-A1-R1_Chr7-1g09171 protein n=1 Tax=Microbotryum saponariae TaxID=289078 RepID=A0A2X0N6R7_9BASI|nr:BZ3501_MvSof-1269-A2-R1_Chr7-1g08876 [Microbotryum saponariae]SDA02932.1 BZ3500_MvSof-1268-A1-R1_Chr7-1g09171 [Microbotryum saponariae]
MSQAPRKQEADHTKDCDETIPVAESLASSGQVQEAVDKLLALEKLTRNSADLASTTRVLIAIISILHHHKQYDLLNTHITLLSKKHGQLRQATQKMVDEAMTYLDNLDGRPKLDLIETLRDVTEGKVSLVRRVFRTCMHQLNTVNSTQIYLEVPRARVTRMLATIREKEGDVAKANELMQDLQVETFGSMERREKVDFILEQMRLLKALEDWDKLGIVAKRINAKWLTEKEHEVRRPLATARGVLHAINAHLTSSSIKDLKLRYYSLMILWGLNAGKYLDVCKFYRQVYETPSIQDDEAKWSAVLRNIVYFVILAPYDNEQSDLLARVFKDEKLVKVTESYDLMKCFTAPELMRWPGIEGLYGASLRQTKVFGPTGVAGIAGDIEEDSKHSKGDKRYEVLHDRIIEHNIRTLSKYYTRMTMTRLSQLLDLTPAKTEAFLSSLVSSKTVYAKIDRPAGIVSFQAPKSGDEVLNEWSSDVGKLMGLIEKSTHLIQKEYAVHAALKAQQGLKA